MDMNTSMERTVSTASYAVSGSAGVWGDLTLNDWLALGGFSLAVLTFLVNIWYRERHYRLERRKMERTEHKS